MDYKTLVAGYQSVISKLLANGWQHDEVMEAYKTVEINYLSALVAFNGFGERVFVDLHEGVEEILAHQRANAALANITKLLYGTDEANAFANEIMTMERPEYLNGIPYDPRKLDDISLDNVKLLSDHGVQLHPNVIKRALLNDLAAVARKSLTEDKKQPTVTFEEGSFRIH